MHCVVSPVARPRPRLGILSPTLLLVLPTPLSLHTGLSSENAKNANTAVAAFSPKAVNAHSHADNPPPAWTATSATHGSREQTSDAKIRNERIGNALAATKTGAPHSSTMSRATATLISTLPPSVSQLLSGETTHGSAASGELTGPATVRSGQEPTGEEDCESESTAASHRSSRRDAGIGIPHVEFMRILHQIHTYIHMYIYIYMCIYVYVYIYVCVCVCARV